MFNRTIVQKGSTEYVPYKKTVTEVRTPTCVRPAMHVGHFDNVNVIDAIKFTGDT